MDKGPASQNLLAWAARLDSVESGRRPDRALVKRLNAAAENGRLRCDTAGLSAVRGRRISRRSEVEGTRGR